MRLNHGRARRLLVFAAGALTLATVTGVSAVFAGNPTKPSPPAAAETTAPDVGSGLQMLVNEERIDQRQADILRQDVDRGSIDLKALVDSGVLSVDQMMAVGKVLVASGVLSADQLQAVRTRFDTDGGSKRAPDPAKSGAAQPEGASATK